MNYKITCVNDINAHEMPMDLEKPVSEARLFKTLLARTGLYSPELSLLLIWECPETADPSDKPIEPVAV